MKNLFLWVIMSAACSSFASPEQEWMGSWVSQKIHCPFGCSQLMQDLYKKSKPKKFLFAVDQIIDASGMSVDCKTPAQPDYSGLKKVKANEYLERHSQNEQAIANPKTRKNLSKLLGLSPDQEVTAGVIHCIDSTGNLKASSQNIIFVNKNKALARFEENAYWELSR